MTLIILWIMGSLTGATLAVYFGEKAGVSVIVGVFASLVVAAQIFANKLVLFGNYAIPAGVIMYSLTFLITDALNEFHGKESAKQAIISGLFGSVLLVIGIHITIAWPAPPFWQGQAAFEQTLGATWRIVVASIVTYLISQSWDVWFFQWIRNKTKGNHLWLRNCLSTISSQLLDTVLFVTIAFAGIFPPNQIIVVIVGQYIAKVVIALLDTPFLYFLGWARKRWGSVAPDTVT